jgi:DNA-binding Lrp family transcriptional regulator
MTPAERPGSTPKAPATTTTPGPALTALQGRVWAVVADRGPVSVPTIAAALGAPERRVREVCAELADAGLITRTGTRWTTSTTATADGGARRPARRDGAPGAAPITTITPPPAPAPTPATVSVRVEEIDFRIGVR